MFHVHLSPTESSPLGCVRQDEEEEAALLAAKAAAAEQQRRDARGTLGRVLEVLEPVLPLEIDDDDGPDPAAAAAAAAKDKSTPAASDAALLPQSAFSWMIPPRLRFKKKTPKAGEGGGEGGDKAGKASERASKAAKKREYLKHQSELETTLAVHDPRSRAAPSLVRLPSRRKKLTQPSFFCKY